MEATQAMMEVLHPGLMEATQAVEPDTQAHAPEAASIKSTNLAKSADKAEMWWAVGRGGRVKMTVEPFELSLRTSFGTAHSATTQRLNALVRLELNLVRRCKL